MRKTKIALCRSHHQSGIANHHFGSLGFLLTLTLSLTLNKLKGKMESLPEIVRPRS
jgi:hypothetical protein